MWDIEFKSYVSTTVRSFYVLYTITMLSFFPHALDLDCCSWLLETIANQCMDSTAVYRKSANPWLSRLLFGVWLRSSESEPDETCTLANNVPRRWILVTDVPTGDYRLCFSALTYCQRAYSASAHCNIDKKDKVKRPAFMKYTFEQNRAKIWKCSFVQEKRNKVAVFFTPCLNQFCLASDNQITHIFHLRQNQYPTSSKLSSEECKEKVGDCIPHISNFFSTTAF